MTGSPPVLVVRDDRLGDVLLCLPALEYLRRSLPDAPIDFVCRQELHDLLRPHLMALSIALVDTADFSRAYGAALFLMASPQLLFAGWRQRVPIRVGIRSKWPSWLWLNRGVAQRRSEGERPEAVYNLELARSLVESLRGSSPEAGEFRIRLRGDSGSEAAAQLALREIGVVGSFLVVHGGMGGSALNLSPEGYAALVAKFPNASVVLSSGPSPHDAPMVEELLKQIPRARKLPSVPLTVLREVFRMAELVVAPSTGPLHLAHYCGTDTVGIFPPVRSQRAERWAPWGGAGRSRVLTPGHPCPGTRRCLGESCESHPCLDRLVREALPKDWADGLMT